MSSSITLKSSSYDGRYMELVCTQKSNGSAKNTSTITWTLSTKGGNEAYYSTGATNVVINGITVYSKARVAWDEKTFPAAKGSTSGTMEVKHKDDGTKSISVELKTAIYTSTVSSYKDTWTLDKIPRYAVLTHSLNSATETTAKINWSSDTTIDGVWYSIDNGENWKWVTDPRAKSGTYTISGLSAYTSYKIKTKVKRLDNQFYTESSALSIKTYDFPFCTASPHFKIGDAVTLKFYNPLSRAFTFRIIGNGKRIDAVYSCSSTSYTGVNSTYDSRPQLYATIPNQKSATYQVEVVYGSSTNLCTMKNTYSVKDDECKPTFSSFTYKDTNSKTVAITGNDQTLIKGYSSLLVEIPASSKMTTKNSATPKNYVVTINGASKTVDYHATNTVSVDMGSVSVYGTPNISVTAYDSRSLSAAASKFVTVYNYAKPTVSVTATRQNNYEAKTTIKINGTLSPLSIGNTNRNAIVDLYYIYREAGGTWSEPCRDFSTTVSNGKFTCTDIVREFDNSKAFEIQVFIEDKLDTANDSCNIDVGIPVFLVSSNKKTAYLNGDEVTTRNNVRELLHFNQLAQNTDLNTIVEPGTYRSVQASHTATMSHLPTYTINGGFTMYVYSWSGNETTTEHRRQEIVYAQHTFIRRTLDGGATWSNWLRLGLVEDVYPVGAVYCSSTNTNPSTLFGGTWELIDKGYKDFTGTVDNAFTPGQNVEQLPCYVTRGAKSVRIRPVLKVNTTLTDTAFELGAFNWANIGITSLPMGFEDMVSYDDAANGGIAWQVAWDTGKATQVDVVGASSIASGCTFTLELTATMCASRMVDSFCDKFYWKRTE